MITEINENFLRDDNEFIYINKLISLIKAHSIMEQFPNINLEQIKIEIEKYYDDVEYCPKRDCKNIAPKIRYFPNGLLLYHFAGFKYNNINGIECSILLKGYKLSKEEFEKRQKIINKNKEQKEINMITQSQQIKKQMKSNSHFIRYLIYNKLNIKFSITKKIDIQQIIDIEKIILETMKLEIPLEIKKNMIRNLIEKTFLKYKHKYYSLSAYDNIHDLINKFYNNFLNNCLGVKIVNNFYNGDKWVVDELDPNFKYQCYLPSLNNQKSIDGYAFGKSINVYDKIEFNNMTEFMLKFKEYEKKYGLEKLFKRIFIL